MRADPRFVHVMQFSNRVGDGFRQIEHGSPWKKALAYILAVVLAIPLIALGIVIVLGTICLAFTLGLIAWITGGRRLKPQQPTAGPTAQGRENVRVIQSRSEIGG